MTETVFEAALTARTAEMLAACTRCGKCVEVCPMAKPAGIGNAAPESVITGVLDIVQTGEGPATSKAWAKGCALTGDCIAACGDGVNPRFLLAMARVAMAKHTSELRNRRKQGVEYFRMVADGVNVLARMQLSEADLRASVSMSMRALRTARPQNRASGRISFSTRDAMYSKRRIWR